MKFIRHTKDVVCRSIWNVCSKILKKSATEHMPSDRNGRFGRISYNILHIDFFYRDTALRTRWTTEEKRSSCRNSQPSETHRTPIQNGAKWLVFENFVLHITCRFRITYYNEIPHSRRNPTFDGGCWGGLQIASTRQDARNQARLLPPANHHQYTCISVYADSHTHTHTHTYM